MEQSNDPDRRRLRAMVPTLAVMAVAIAAVATAIVVTQPQHGPALDQRVVVAPPVQRDVVKAPPLTGSMGAAPACRACGVVEAVAPKADSQFQMRIRMDDGSVRTVEQRGALAAGSRVVVEKGAVRLMPGPTQG